MAADELDDALRTGRRGAPGPRIVTEYGIDDCTLAAVGLIHNVAECAGLWIEEWFDARLHDVILVRRRFVRARQARLVARSVRSQLAATSPEACRQGCGQPAFLRQWRQ